MCTSNNVPCTAALTLTCIKALIVLEYLLYWGSDNVIRYCQDNLYEIKTLREFQYIDDEDHDQGANVRQKAKDITNLLSDKQRLFQERRARAQMRDRMAGRARSSGDTDDGSPDPLLNPARRRRPLPNGLQRPVRDEEEDMRRAIEESMRSAAEERATAEDLDLVRALKLSEEEEEERRKKLMEQNASSLFDDAQQQ